MNRGLWLGACCGVLLFLAAGQAWAGVSLEEMQRAREKISAETAQRMAKKDKAAEALFKKNDPDLALELCEELLDDGQMDKETHAEVLVIRGMAYYKKNKPQQAQDNFSQALRVNPKEARAYLGRAKIHETQNRRDKAVADVEAYLRLQPQDRKAQAWLQQLQEPAGAPPPAPKATPAPQKAVPDRAGRLAKRDQALQAFDKNDPDRALALCGELLAEENLDNALRSEVLVLRGLVLFKKNQLPQAQADLTNALKLNANLALAYMIRSTVHERQNRRDLAVADLEAYLRLKPQDKDAQARLQRLKGTAPSPQSSPKAPPPPASQAPAPQPSVQAAMPFVAEGSIASPAPALQPFLGGNKLYALHKPADWQVVEQAGQGELWIKVQAPDQASAVDFLWMRNPQGQVNALPALRDFAQRMRQAHPDAVWRQAYLSRDAQRAMATFRYQTAAGPVLGKVYLEATPQSLSAQGYCGPEAHLARLRPLLLNIMASLAFVKGQARPSEADEVFQPQYVNPPLVTHQAPDGSLSLNIPADWEFVGAGGKAIASGPRGGLGFIFTSLAGSPQLRGASVMQGIIDRPYLPPPDTLRLILAAFGHRDIKIGKAEPDVDNSNEFQKRVGRRGEAQDMEATWTSAKGVACWGFFKVVNAAPSPTGQWFCIVAGLWGPQQDFYRYYPLLEQVGNSFAIDDQYARRYIREGLRRARMLHDRMLGNMRHGGGAGGSHPHTKAYAYSPWEDYRRGQPYWVSQQEGAEAYHGESGGRPDSLAEDYYEGKPYRWTSFEGPTPQPDPGTMRELSGSELRQMTGDGG